MRSSGSGRIRDAWPAQPKDSKRLADLARRRCRGLEELAWTEIGGVVVSRAPHRGGHRQADVGVDVHLANAVTDTLLDFLHRHAVGLGNFTAVLAQQRQPFLR